MSASRHYAHFLEAGTLAVTVTAPTSGATITTVVPTITWEVSGGTGLQQAYRVSIYTDAGGVNVVYDSGWIVGSVAEYQIPSGVLQTDRTYYVRVDVQDTNGAQGESILVDFLTDFATSVDVTNVRVDIYGDKCNEPNGLPYARIRWNQVVPGGGETFVRYLVRRRAASTSEWVNIASIEVISTLVYKDYTIAAYTPYQYSVVWQAEAGSDTLQSEDTANLVAYVEFDYMWLHDIADPTYHVRLDSLEPTQQRVEDIGVQEVWGRSAPSVVIGSKSYGRFSVPVLPQPLKHNGLKQWDRILQLMDRQRENGSVLCMRHGATKTRVFCNIVTPPNRSNGTHQYNMTMELSEVYYDEDAA